jgi:excisionase family DNA binding protein
LEYFADLRVRPMKDEVLTIRDVAEYLKVNEKTVYGLAQQSRIPAFKVGGQWRFRRDDIVL